jgi:hypothetical protein
LQESLAEKKHDRDYGLIMGAKMTAWFRNTFNLTKRQKRLHAEHEPLLSHQKLNDDEETAAEAPVPIRRPQEAPSIRDVLSYQTTLNLVVYTLLAFYTLAYDQVCIEIHQIKCCC